MMRLGHCPLKAQSITADNIIFHWQVDRCIEFKPWCNPNNNLQSMVELLAGAAVISWVSDLHLKIQALSFVEFYILGHCFAFCTVARVTFVVFQFSIASPVSFCFSWSPHICFLFATSCFILVVFCLLCFVLIIQFLLVLLPRFSSPVHYFP